MAARHAFVDESSRQGYLLCAVVVSPANLATARSTMRALRRPGQRRVHMKHESNCRRREILSSISDLDFEAYVYRTRLGDQSERTARDACLRTMMSDLMALSVVRMVIETCDQDHHDNQLIRRLVANEVARGGFDYLHSTPAVEPLLWLPDIVAWAFGRGGDWRRRAAALLAEVKDV